MHLAKFFHRAPGDDDRELLLIPGSDMLLGIHMRELDLRNLDFGNDLDFPSNEFLRQQYATLREAVAAMREEAEKLRAAGYVETTHTNHTLRTLLPDPQPKPAWQQGLDEMMLDSLVEPLDVRAKRIAELSGSPAAAEPLYLWLAGHHALAAFPDDNRALPLAEAARDARAARRAAKQPHYAWSIRDHDLEERILDLLFEAQLRAGQLEAALETIELACDIAPSQERFASRAWFLSVYVPERRDEAFFDAYRYGSNGSFDAILDDPAYTHYVARRAVAKGRDAWHWSGRLKPAGEAALASAEAKLGVTLPEGYRRFLSQPGYTRLMVGLPGHSGVLRFYRPEELDEQRQNLFDFITMSEPDKAKAEAYFLGEYGVSLRHLVPVAVPENLSNWLVLHLGAGERHGWCFQWNHDGAWELEEGQPGFTAALAQLTRGAEEEDARQLEFLGIYLR
jgi:hypothetical protein